MSLWDYLNKTNLPTKKEIDYQVIKSQQRPYDSGADYDLRGFYSQYGNLSPQATNGHLTDEFKTEIHPTFSNESKYYAGQPYAVDWESPLYSKLSDYGVL